MRGAFDDEELEPAQPRRDTELTLGSGMLLAIFFGLVLVCGLCFGLGYAVGHRGPQPPSVVVQPAPGAQVPVQSDGFLPKPSPTAPAGAAPSPQTAAVNPPAAQVAGANPVAGSQAAAPAAQPGSFPSLAQVHPALPAVAAAPQAVKAAAAPKVAPAIPAAVPLMVQIAAVANPEDADVLVSALRKRGYSVTVRRDPADSLIHVRIGPFNGSAEAEKWRQKLLNDGYNAIVQP